MTNFRLFQTEGVCRRLFKIDENGSKFSFKIDENGSKFSKKVKNIVGKREIAHYEQFLLFSSPAGVRLMTRWF